MIITGGINVYPDEGESVLASHPAVSAVAAAGIPDQQWGEAIVAVVVVRPGLRVSEEEMVEFTDRQLAGYKKPNRRQRCFRTPCEVTFWASSRHW